MRDKRCEALFQNRLEFTFLMVIDTKRKKLRDTERSTEGTLRHMARAGNRGGQRGKPAGGRRRPVSRAKSGKASVFGSRASFGHFLSSGRSARLESPCYRSRIVIDRETEPKWRSQLSSNKLMDSASSYGTRKRRLS